MANRVRVIGIFTRGARSCQSSEQRYARLSRDIGYANRVWGQGSASSRGNSLGTKCDISFFAERTWDYTDVTLDGDSLDGAFDASVSRIIDGIRTSTGNAAAIYVVYVSGDYLANGSAIGSGGPQYRFYREPSDYGFYGQIVMTDLAGTSRSPYAFAHEAGHCLFGYLDSSNRYIGSDPSTDGYDHHGDERNLMYYSATSGIPYVNQAQCSRASRSTIVIGNTGRRSSGSLPLKLSAKPLRAYVRPRIRLCKTIRLRKSLTY